MARKHIMMIVMCLLLIGLIGCKSEDTGSDDSADTDDSDAVDEYVPECTADDGCVGEQTCMNGTCTDPDCKGCTYLDVATHTCEEYECCVDKDCDAEKKCSYNKCVAIECGHCQYVNDHTCTAYKCCGDSECDDSNEKTTDECKNAGTKEAVCLHIPTGNCSKDFRCFTDLLEDCDDAEVVIDLESDDDEWEWAYELKITISEKDDDVCEFLMEILSVEVDITDDYYDQLDDEGNDEDEIDDIIAYKNEDIDDYEGDKERCDIDFNDLDDVRDVLDSWRDDDLFTMDEFDCGSLTP